MVKPTIRKTDSNLHIIDFPDKVVAGLQKKFLLMSDVHIDSIKCDRELLKKHLKQAQDQDAHVMIFGDLFDIMQGRKDRRSAKHSLDREILTRMLDEGIEYYDAACALAVDFFKPFKDNLLFISYGNHETAINRHNEFDILQRFAKHLDMTTGQYEGYVKLNFSNAQRSTNKLLKYHHGYGGAKRSKGMLDSQLFAYVYSDADICVRGHNHYKFLDTNGREKVTERGKIRQTKQYHLNLGTYKRKDPGMGWETEKGFYPSVPGGWWLDINLISESNHIVPKIKIYEAD